MVTAAGAPAMLMVARPANAGPAVSHVPLPANLGLVLTLQDSDGNATAMPEEDPVLSLGDAVLTGLHVQRRALDLSCAVSGLLFTQPGTAYVKVRHSQTAVEFLFKRNTYFYF